MEPDQDGFTIRGDWSRKGVASIVGTYSLATFGDLAVANLHEGRPLIINDNIKEIGEEQSAMFLQIGIRATICMPFVKQGVLTALMAIHCAQPRQWTPDELALLSEVTERSWAHIERVRSAAALRDLNATLEQRVSDEIAARSRTEAQLQQAQKMEAIGQLTGGIAHDFNNMLSVVVGGLQLTKRRLAQGNTDVAGFIDGALEGVQRAASLTQRLLAFSRRQSLAPEVVEPNKLVAAMIDLLARTLGETVQVETRLMPGLWNAHADPVQLESAILNLCVNSRDAMPQGGRLTLETANVYVEDEASLAADLPAGQYVTIAVCDTGEGMSPEVMARAFDPFFTTKSVGKGSGLGLSQVFGFVRQSGGHVKIESTLGQGTTVRIYLPRHEGEAKASSLPVERQGSVSARPGETILVVEDEERVRKFSAAALAELGYNVLVATSARDALLTLNSPAEISLLFTDIVMPEMTGHDLADEAIKVRPGLRVLFTTGYARNATGHSGMREQGADFLQKPFGIDQLAIKVRTVLDRS
jgi:signal transduction histidine kinase/CheY-like chemotaxis protein